jgi:hypothetical protein
MHAINVSYTSLSVTEGPLIEGARRTMQSSLLWPPNPHAFRALGGALVWGLIEFVALARSRRSARRAIRR